MSQKAKRIDFSEEIINEIAGDLLFYLLNGNLSSFINTFDPSLDINDINRLLRIHFILTEKKNENDVGVIDFIQDLTKNLGSIKTISSPKTQAFKGKVKGKINWKKTNDLRSKTPFQGKTLFVCDKKEKNYDIIENLVLKKILQIIYKIVFEDLGAIIKGNIKRDWLANWLKEDHAKYRLIDEFFQIYHRNIYLRRISLEKVKINDRNLRKVLKSRSQLYRNGAKLLIKYRKLINYEINKREVKELLKNTFILPERKSVLFELYWIIQIVRLFKIKEFNNIKYDIREPKENLVASWSKDNYTYNIYHDTKGTFKFYEKINDLNEQLDGKDNYFSRSLLVKEKLAELLSKEKYGFGSRRPDIILEKINNKGNCIGLLIGEVKYTNDKGYAITGLGELLEYIALIKEKNLDKKYHYKEAKTDLFVSLKSITGILFTREIKNFSIKPKSNINVIQYGENLKLTEVINKFIS